MRYLWTTALLLGMTTAAVAGNWPQWRGPAGNGVAEEQNLPLKWSATENVRWKIPLPSPGNSTPIIWGTRLFLTQSLDGTGRERAVICFRRQDGKELWRRVVRFDGKESTHRENPYCSSSPVTDGKRVIAWLGSAGVVCYDLEGKPLWQRDLGTFEFIWGNASSPTLYKNLVILNCGPGERTFLIALDKRTGKTVWKVDIPGGKAGANAKEWVGSWSTPRIATLKGRDEVIVSWSRAVKSYDPQTGKLLWTCGGLTDLVYTSPLITPEVIVAMSGYGGSYLAVKTGGSGDITKTHRLWRMERSAQRIGSGVILGDMIYMVNANGVAQGIDLKTGKTLWEERLPGGGVWASLVQAGGRLYVTNLRGETFVLAAKPTFEVLAQNSLGEKTLASVAVSEGEVFIRTWESLWCLGG